MIDWGIMVFAMILKKVGLLDIIKEIFSTFLDFFHFGNSVINGGEKGEKDNSEKSSSHGKSYFS